MSESDTGRTDNRSNPCANLTHLIESDDSLLLLLTERPALDEMPYCDSAIVESRLRMLDGYC